MWLTAQREASYRSASEDRSLILEHGDGILLAVADGVGGKEGGAQAADIAIRTLRRKVASAPNLQSPRVWQVLLGEIDNAISDDEEAGETTLTAVYLTPRKVLASPKMVGAFVGDTEAWLITETDCISVTDAPRRKPYLGYGGAQPVSFKKSLPYGTTVLVASDGLFKYADRSVICALARLPSLDEASDQLIASARSSSGSLHDDITVLLCRLLPRRKMDALK